MSEASVQKELLKLAKREGLSAEGCVFVNEAVAYSVSRLAKRRHVSARELAAGVRDLALQKYGVAARMVLAEYGLVSVCDLGKIVYKLIDGGILSASPGDDPADFDLALDLAPQAPEEVRMPRSRTKIDL